ncbi:MAG: hypothetical protein JNL01_12685 [Bdellovibrionales bacterium]|nr:hypothetical protein [Bdellovibrionales bacterium]
MVQRRMLKKALFFVALIGLTLPVNPGHACVVFDSESIDDPNSIAYKNMEAVRDYLVKVGELELGGWVANLLSRGKIYQSEKLDHWFHGTLQGCATLPLNVTLRSDFVHPGDLLSFDLTATDQQFRGAADLLRLMVHEFIHIIDLNKTSVSFEQDTYARSFTVLSSILKKHLLDQAAAFATSDPARSANYRRQAMIFASVLSMEIATYDVDEYGEISDGYFPLLDHQGCVRTMNRKEYPVYLNILSSTGNLPTWDDYVARVDSMAKSHLPPAVAGNCSKPVKIAAPLPDQAWTVGHESVRHRFKVYEVDISQTGRMLRMTKKGPAADLNKIQLTAYEQPDFSNPRKLKEIGRIPSHWTSMRYVVSGNGNGIKIFVEENNPGEFPGTISIEAFEEWYGTDGAAYQAPLTLREVSVAAVGMMGYYPPAGIEKDAKLNFFSRVFFEDARDQMVAFEMELKKGDVIDTHLSLPPAGQFDQAREGRWYRVPSAGTGTGPTAAPLVLEGVMQRTDAVREFRAYQDGRYLFVVRRMGRTQTLAHYSVRFDVMHTGQRDHNPQFIQIDEIGPNDYYRIRSTLPMEFTVEGSMDAGVSYVGYRQWYSALTGPAVYKPFQVYKLNTQEKDVIRINRFSATEMAESQCFISEGAALTSVFSYTVSCESFEFQVPDNKDYYWVVLGSATPGISQNYSAQIQLNRISDQPSWNWSPTWIQDPAFFKKLGVAPLQEYRLESQQITALHPKGFLVPDSRYLAYRIQTTKDSYFAMSHPAFGIQRRIYLAEFDPTKWAAGQPALKNLYNGTQGSWTHHRELPAGEYILVIEGGYKIDAGEVPALLRFTGVDLGVKVDPVSYTDLTNPAFKLFF